VSSLIDALGTRRVLEPGGALPQAALRLDASLPLAPYEIEVDVDTLCLDSTSFRQLSEANDRDPGRIGAGILEIVAARGKMHNPVTGSGGILAGTVRAVGDEYPDPPVLGARIVPLASLTWVPLRLDRVLEVDPSIPHVRVAGTAYLSRNAPWAPYPSDLPFAAALAALDVCTAASQTRSLIHPEMREVLVLGGGHAGLVAMAAARDTLAPGARVVLMDASEDVCARGSELGLCDVALRVDLRDAVSSLRALEQADCPRADLTVVVVNATDCEAAALLLTADHGTVLFFSMATVFNKVALGAECMAASATMVVGSGYTPDGCAYALDLLRRDERLVRALAYGSG
jgi:L-erythro-3,5-diaminohexanoate dehydrogenase